MKASEEREDFYNLLGKEVTFASDLISIGGYITHKKGEKAFISDVEYSPGFWSWSGDYIGPKISSFKINGVPSCCFLPTIFIEYKSTPNE